ncbi:MAG: DUF1307 domain-containing protein [Bacilli bacterium]|nr:DUF1307 domain-containing protein [Bacilli bacterium]
MKKIIKSIILVISVLLLTACGTEDMEKGITVSSKTDTSNKNGTLLCSRSAEAQNNAKASFIYEIDYKNGYITKLHSKEEITSSSDEVLDTYEEAYRNIFKAYEDLKYYDNNITRSKSSVVSDTTIDYSKVDIEKLKEIEAQEDSIIKNGKVSLKDWLTFAETFGTTCIEK